MKSVDHKIHDNGYKKLSDRVSYAANFSSSVSQSKIFSSSQYDLYQCFI